MALSNTLYPSDDEGVDVASTVSTLCEYVSPLLTLVANGQQPENDEEDGDNDEDICGVVAGLTLDLLAGDSEFGTRGIRDAARKFWRSEESRVGQECVSRGRSRWWPYH